MIATIWLYALVSVSESVSAKFSALYFVSKVSEKSGIGPPLILITLNCRIIDFASSANNAEGLLTIDGKSFTNKV